MRPSGSDLEAIASREERELSPKLHDLPARVSDIVANLRAQLDDRLMHLGLDLFFQDHFALGENFLDVRTELARFRIDDLEFLFDADGENVVVHW
jgi:hypothetical protein